MNKKYTCPRCKKASPAERMTYSRHTGNRYCRDFDACDRRRARLPLEQRQPTTRKDLA